jgi:predicted Zn-dependent peptidase
VLEELAYENPAYEHSVIGSLADLSAASVDDVAAFFKTYYAPNNAVVSIAGDVNSKVTLEKIRKYFESIPSQPAPPSVDATEPEQTAERRTTIEDVLARLPRIDMVYKTPPSSSADEDAISVMTTILSGGRSSRFYEAIVRQKQLAAGGVGASREDSRSAGLLTIIGTAAPGKTLTDLEAAIEEEIEKLKKGPIEEWEMEKARNVARSGFVSSLGSSLQRAVILSEYAVLYDNPQLINTRADRIAKVSAADVQRVAQKYLVKTGRTVVLTVPKAPPAKGGSE